MSDIRLEHSEPQVADYHRQSLSEYPQWFTNGLFALLGFIALGALFVSAGKQLAAADIVFEDLLSVTDRLSPFWVSASLIILLMVGEVGSLVFMTAAATVRSNKLATRIFRGLGFYCAAIALGQMLPLPLLTQRTML
ncbi:MAG: hypothetical protein ABI947_14950 [Chloroflexota bacterium]